MPAGVQKGRGALSNRTGRFEALAVEAVDDGWGIADEPLPPLATAVNVVVPETVVAVGAEMATVSGVTTTLLTVTVRVAVAVRPVESFTVAVSVWLPLATVVVFHPNGVVTVAAGAESTASV